MSGGIRVGALLLALLLQVLMARWLGLSQYGVYTYWISVTSLAAVAAGLGLPSAALRVVPR